MALQSQALCAALLWRLVIVGATFPAFSSSSFTAQAAPSFAAPSFAASSFPFPPVRNPSLPTTVIWGTLPAASSSLTTTTTTTTAQPMSAQTLALLTNPFDAPLLDKQSLVATQRLYDQQSFRNWNIQMAQRDIDAMNANPTAQTDYPCSITSAYGSPTAKTFKIPAMSCRYKGAVGSLRMCVDQYGRLNGACRKLSWAVDVNGLKLPKTNSTKKQTIHGAKKLTFGGCPVDWSLMSERMSYSLLNAMNVTSPLAAHAKLFLNGKFLGVYSFVEPVDTTFTKQRFSGDKTHGKGGLYKEIWFNQVSMQKLVKARKGGTTADDTFMRTIMATIDATPLTQDAATRMFSQYFDTQSFIDVTALNTIIGQSDDWRQKHNFFWYVLHGSTGSRVVMIPWDYDRLYDAQALTRGPLEGQPWWNIQATALPARCYAAPQTAQQRAAATATSQSDMVRQIGIFEQMPADNQIPVTCDKITQLLSLAFGAAVRARTKEFLNLVSLNQIQSWFSTWNAQIQPALAYDPDGPSVAKMLDQQNKLLSHLSTARTIALNQANMGDSPVLVSQAVPLAVSPGPFMFPRPMFRNG